MSILIKGIDLPKDIDFVEITTYKNGIPQMTIGKGRDDAIQIPTPHGRLIDADKVFTYDKIAEDQLKEVPAILEEEKMRKYICDVCRKEIKESDIHVQMDLGVADNKDVVDLHSTCYYKLLRTVKELLDELNEDEKFTIKAENV